MISTHSDKISIVQFRNVSKVFSRRQGTLLTRQKVSAVKSVSFAVYENEIFALVGASGAGKSTIGRILMGLLVPDKGDVLVFGRKLETVLREKERWYRRHCQFIFQDAKAALSPRMRINKLLGEALLDSGLPKETKDQKVVEIIQQVGLEERHLLRLPSQLSGGEAQRVCIARALLKEPRLLVCDEPTSSLDVSTEWEIVQLLLSIKQKLGITMLFITHNLTIVHKIADRIGVMHKGELIDVGGRDEIFNNAKHEYTRRLVSNL